MSSFLLQLLFLHLGEKKDSLCHFCPLPVNNSPGGVKLCVDVQQTFEKTLKPHPPPNIEVAGRSIPQLLHACIPYGHANEEVQASNCLLQNSASRFYFESVVNPSCCTHPLPPPPNKNKRSKSTNCLKDNQPPCL